MWEGSLRIMNLISSLNVIYKVLTNEGSGSQDALILFPGERIETRKEENSNKILIPNLFLDCFLKLILKFDFEKIIHIIREVKISRKINA